MENQLLEHGEVIEHKDHEFEVVSISAKDDDGVQHHFKYELQLHSEAEDQRKLDAESTAREQQRVADLESEAETPDSEPA